MDAGVHFEEVEVSCIVHEELHRPSVLVLNGFGQFDGGFSHPFAEVVIEKGRGRFFEKFLVAALNRAVAFADVNNFAALVPEDLEFDVMRFFDIFLKIDIRVSEGFFCLHPCGEKTFHEADVVVGGSHSFAPATRDGLNHYWVADLFSGFDGFLLRSNWAIASWGMGTPALRAFSRASDLSPIRRIDSGEGPMKRILQDWQTSAKWAFSDRNP